MNGRARTALWIVLLVAAAAALVVLYVLPYVSHLQTPPGDDATFYIGAIRDVPKLGLVDPQVAARPAYPLLGAMLGSVSGASPWIVTTGLPIALVVALGFAAAALASRWGLRGPGVAAFAFLAALSAVAARLVAGKAENLMILALLAALLAVTAWAGGLRRWVGMGVLALAAGLTEWPLMLGFVGIAGLDLVIRLIRRDREAVRETLPLAVMAAAGFVVALAAVLIGSSAALAIQHLPGAARYGPRLTLELRLMWAPLTAALIALGWWAARRFRRREVEGLRHLLTVWLVVTLVVTAVGLAGAGFPSYRVLTFALPVLLASAAAAFVVVRWHSSRKVVAVARPVLGVLIALASLLPAADMWFRGLPPAVSAPAIAQIDAAGRYAASLPGRTPAVLVVRLKAIKFLVYQRVVHDVLPVGSGGRMLVYIGDADAALAGRPGKAFTPQGQAVIKQLFPPIRRALRAGAPILTGSNLNAHSFATAVANGAPTVGGGDVAVIRGPAPASNLVASDLPIPIEPADPALFAVFAMLAIAAAGVGWGLLLFPRASGLVVAALVPALGTAALSIVAFAASRVGVLPHGSAAVAELSVGIVASVVAAVIGIRLRRSTEPLPEPAAPTGADSAPPPEIEPDGEFEPEPATSSEPEPAAAADSGSTAAPHAVEADPAGS